ncbi:hypothetical protein GCM10022222_33500 [Amycolatopsis ultiminotia]|uniref:Lysophospholipase, alpha-beta hydrolase superfamily n=1 Tax=Amycolatopsis ultiminotia TaxID=543629 RepID=A0ABP6W707_9PSEU
MSRYKDFPTPAELRTRGTVLIAAGRGETPAAYARLGSRLAADAYQVRIVEAPEIDPADVPGSLDGFAAALTAATDGLPDRPLVLAGADSGAAALAALAGSGDSTAAWWPDALVLAGLPGPTGVTGTWAAELDVRTSCPVHRGVLTDSAVRGKLATPLPDALLHAAYRSAPPLPQLVLIGADDPLADRAALARTVKAAPRARLSVVHGAHHDVLNDRQHRSVAAELVSFLETLGNELVPVISVESSAW